MFITAPGEAIALVEQWITNPALRELVEADGGSWPAGDLATIVRELEDFSSVWDRRDGRSRLVFKDGHESRTDSRALRTYAAAKELGLIDPPAPSNTAPDYILVLGGLATGVEPRVRYAAELVLGQSVTTERVVALGSFRELEPREREAAAHYAPDAHYEIDLLTAMVGRSFDAETGWLVLTIGDPSNDPARAEQRRSRNGEPDLSVYAARSSDPSVRPANTLDTYRQFAADVEPRSGQTILILTSAIYLPYQHMDAVRGLGGRGLTIESIGVRSATGGVSHPPSAYLQEIRSAIRAAKSLLEWVANAS